MRRVHYGELAIDFTDGEYERLQSIKSDRYDNPAWAPPKGAAKASDKVASNINIPERIKRRAKEFAKSKGVSFSRLVSDVLEVVTNDNT